MFEEIPNANSIKVLVYNGMRFVVSKDLQEGDLVCLFPADGELSHNFCYNNNLYRHSNLNKDNSISGYFEDNRRVRAQPFMGVKSEGFVCTANAFSYIKGDFHFNDGDEFDTINGNLICEKYVTEATKQAIAKQGKYKKPKKFVEYALNKHFDTAQFDYRVDSITPGMCLVSITEKLHGTSARTGYVIKQTDSLPWYGRIINNIFRKRIIDYKTNKTYELVSGTRNTIVNTRPEFQETDAKEHYRWIYHKFFEGKLYKGETIFYEIVGYNQYGNPIMGVHSTEKLSKKIGLPKNIVYSYGCDMRHKPNDIFVYRITQQNEDGIVFEVPWLGVVERCEQLGIKHVPILHTWYMSIDDFSIDTIKASVDKFVSNSPLSVLDRSHVREGVCVRIESTRGMMVLKKKTFEFLVMEGIAKDKSDYVDIEEVS